MSNNRVLIAAAALVVAAIACEAPGAQPSQPSQVASPAAEVTAAPTVAPTPTQQAAQPTAAPVQPTTSSVVSGSPQRISFAAGAVSASVSGAVNAGTNNVYLINAGAGQTMTLALTSSGTLGLGVAAPGGTVMQDAGAGLTHFSAPLPKTGDYTITVVQWGGGQTAFTLQVSIPPVASGGSASSGPCWVTTAQAIVARRESALTAEVFGTASAGDQTAALARTKDNWLGFDPGVAQAGNQGRARLRWYQTSGASFTFDPPGCENQIPWALSLQTLQNNTYHVLDLANVTLVDGKFTDSNFDFSGSTGQKVYSSTMTQVMAFGDLNGDGSEDAVIVLGTNTGGSGTFVEIMPVLNLNGDFHPAGSIMVGDRTPVNALSIQNGLVTAEVTVGDADDGACCPTLNQTWILKLVNGALVQQ